jgi:hypothetical protein
MVGVVKANGNEIANAADAGTDARVAAHGRQLVGFDLGEFGKTLGRQRLAHNIRYQAGEVANTAFPVDNARLLTPGRSITHKLHRISFLDNVGTIWGKVATVMRRQRREDKSDLLRNYNRR